MKKKVSILSPNYNGGQYLKNYLQSVLDQTYKNIELIIVDDASEDDSTNIIESFKNAFDIRGMHLLMIKLAKNSGQAAAINAALQHFTGEYVMWMDSDDILFPNAIQKKVDFMEANPHIEFALCQAYEVKSDSLDTPVRILKRTKPIGEDNLFADVIVEKNIVYGNGSSFVKTEAFKRAIPSMHIFESREGQNLQLLLPLSYCCRVGYIEEPLFKYVVHSDSHFHSERTYEQKMLRWNGIESILKETIKAIDIMPEHEKDYWTIESEKRVLIEKLYCTSYYGDHQQYKILKKKLFEIGGSLPKKRMYWSEQMRLKKNRYKRAIINIWNKYVYKKGTK